VARERAFDELRPVRLHLGFTDATPGSVLIEMGRTRVLCTAAFDSDVPRWLRDTGRGWVTAEYAMLPGSTPERVRREHYMKGRALEISRLIGRSLRAVVDLDRMGEQVIRVDCDVLQADGGTRTAAVTGGWVALWQACQWGMKQGILSVDPIRDRVAAISVGVVGGLILLDLDYEDDVNAEVDLNVVMAGSGDLVEVQGTAEGKTFSRHQLDQMLDLAEVGIRELVDAQRRATEE
jgi:ribonuclease PH